MNILLMWLSIVFALLFTTQADAGAQGFPSYVVSHDRITGRTTARTDTARVGRNLSMGLVVSLGESPLVMLTFIGTWARPRFDNVAEIHFLLDDSLRVTLHDARTTVTVPDSYFAELVMVRLPPERISQFAGAAKIEGRIGGETFEVLPYHIADIKQLLTDVSARSLRAPSAVASCRLAAELTSDPREPTIDRVHPRFPREMKAAGKRGWVLVRTVVGVDGRIDAMKTETLFSSDPMLTAAVLEIIPRYRMSPGEVRGEAVRSCAKLAFWFSPRFNTGSPGGWRSDLAENP
ncbi:MAG: energy transducer TonB [Gemmatimonadaceae bacterium]